MAGILCAVAPLLYVPHFAGSMSFLGDVEGALAWMALDSQEESPHSGATRECLVYPPHPAAAVCKYPPPPPPPRLPCLPAVRGRWMTGKQIRR